ncbi:HalOD1 output domain-containing protein [Natrinema soli]|uniref:HalOD1 output domain-containing protein n=1 Tax=Natrinema soli TaxID=1930624 RepID=A0ABD5SUZ0_9EURY|nr:HalOD1 output domain-containing protein [Natrinema soli]
MSYLDNTSTPHGTVPPTQAIIEAIAARECVDVTDVEPPAYDPLFTVVNPEALDELFTTTADTASSVVVRLEYEGYDIVVRDGSDVEIRDRSAGDSVNSPIGE